MGSRAGLSTRIQPPEGCPKNRGLALKRRQAGHGNGRVAPVGAQVGTHCVFGRAERFDHTGEEIRRRPGRSRQSGLPTPAGLFAPDHYGVAAWPLVCEKQRLPRKVFRRSIAWLSDSLFTLRSAGCPAPRKTRFRPLVRRYRTGFPPAGFR